MISTAFSGFFSTILTITSETFFFVASLLFALSNTLLDKVPLLFSTKLVTISKSSSLCALSTAFSTNFVIFCSTIEDVTDNISIFSS